jgi:hypothetical protein
MAKILLNSSNLKSVDYDDQTKTLEVEFNRGGSYRYLEVPQEVVNGLIDSKSAGVYFAAKIRNKYTTEKL